MTSFMQITVRRGWTRKVTTTGRVMLTLKGLKVMMTLIMLITRRVKMTGRVMMTSFMQIN